MWLSVVGEERGRVHEVGSGPGSHRPERGREIGKPQKIKITKGNIFLHNTSMSMHVCTTP